MLYKNKNIYDLFERKLLKNPSSYIFCRQPIYGCHHRDPYLLLDTVQNIHVSCLNNSHFSDVFYHNNSSFESKDKIKCMLNVCLT